MNLFLRFPKLDLENPLSAEAMQETVSQARTVYRFWTLGSFGLLPLMLVLALWAGFEEKIGYHPIPTPFLEALALLFLLTGIFSALFGPSARDYELFKPITDASTTLDWDCHTVWEFFEQYPEVQAYREKVLQEGRPFYAGELEQLKAHVLQQREHRDCLRLYASHESPQIRLPS
jgi:hypothetical protein